MAKTPLDRAHGAMSDAPDNDALRLAFYRRLADTTLFLLLEREPAGADAPLDPELLELGGTDTATPERYALAFDTEERLAGHGTRLGRGALPYAALPGRIIAGALAGQGVGLAVNLDAAPSSILLPAAALDWLAETLAAAPEAGEATLTAIAPPTGLPEGLTEALAEKLAATAGLAERAIFVKSTYSDGRDGWLLAFVEAHPGAEAALARTAQEALVFSGTDLASVDVAFFGAGDAITARLDQVGLGIDLAAAEPGEPANTGAARSVSGPGMNPDRPPILK